jgi:Holliday junction resolvase RusA-like endonuclease
VLGVAKKEKTLAAKQTIKAQIQKQIKKSIEQKENRNVEAKVIDTFAFEIPGKIKGKQRARIYTDCRGVTRGRTPDETVNYEAWIKMCFIDKYRRVNPTCEPVSVTIRAFYVRPKSNTKREPVTVRTDADNVAKSILDACNGLVYLDDRQVVRLSVSKEWGETERVLVEIKII